MFWLQSALKELGYYDTKVTGKMLGKTVKAVKAFQKDHGIYQNGIASQELVNMIGKAVMQKRAAAEQPVAAEASETPAPAGEAGA